MDFIPDNIKKSDKNKKRNILLSNKKAGYVPAFTTNLTEKRHIVKPLIILPDKIRGGETWIWVDKNGNVFELGKDFMVAEEKDTYPCKVYRLQNVASAYNDKKPQLNKDERANNKKGTPR